RDREVFLFERRPGDAVEEPLHDGAKPALPTLLERDRGSPLSIPAVADPPAVFRDERQGEFPEPLIQFLSPSTAHEPDVVRGLDAKSFQDSRSAVVRACCVPMPR